jgi:hypothetical protein
MVFILFFLISLLSASQTFPGWIMGDHARMKCTGELSNQFFYSDNIDVLNSCVPQDVVAYILSTLDYYIKFDYGKDAHHPRLNFYTDLRFQYAWGSFAEARILNSQTILDQVVVPVYESRLNKHVLWLREIWTKIGLGADLKKHDHYVQLGLIPYEIGRAISLGAAYQTVGFLGFTPTYSIDQYAPSILFSFNPSGKNFINFYAALIESEQDSLENILAPIHAAEIGNCPQRGIDSNSYIVALHNKTFFNLRKGHSIAVEPYLIYLNAPDKTLELTSDVDSELATAGICVEADFGPCNWGFECAKNFGAVLIKPLDRNKIKIVHNPDDGILVEQYTKIYNEPPLDADAQLVYATAANAAYVNNSPKTAAENGQQIGPNLYNAYDRFRPKQNINLTGYYFIADVAYDYIPKLLQGAVGVGYFSGSDRTRVDLNQMTPEHCLNRSFNGFIPLQSIYSGKRIRHFVMLNQGVPRYTVQSVQPNFSLTNPTNSITLDTLNATTNLIFVGTRAAFSPQRYKQKKVLVAPNIIGYWAADTSYVSDEKLPANSPFLKELDNYLGTEFNVEFSFEITENLKFSGYMGMLLPGAYYQQIAGTIVRDYNLPVGADIAYIGDFAISYKF